MWENKLIHYQEQILFMTDIKDKLWPLFKDEQLKILILFGSVALGREHTGSDVDLAFLFDGPVDIIALTNSVITLLKRDDVDVVDLQRASPLLSFLVLKQGLLLYERFPGLFSNFYSLTFRRYIDTKKLRYAQSKAINSFLEQKGLT